MKISGALAERGLHVFDHETPTRDGVRLPRLWLIVADREKAYVYRKTLHAIEKIASLRAEPSHREKGEGALSHGHDSRSEKRHHEDGAFLKSLTTWIDKAANENSFDRLIIAAPPHALGDMRYFLGVHAQSRLAAEVNKDWTKLPVRDIEKHLSGIAYF